MSAQTGMNKKLPKLFRSPIKPERFEKKVLKRIFLRSEREFLLGIVVQDEKKRYTITRELKPAELKRLKSLAKAIKKNKGLVTGWKAMILLISITLVILFNLFMKNILVERVVEDALRSVFQAESEVTGTRFALLRGSISFDSLAVADRSSPKRNLFELGRTELDLNTWELLKKRLIIERAVCSGIGLNTPRTSSGALDSAPPAEAFGAPAAEAGYGGLASLAADTDPESLLASQLDRLQSLPQIEETNRAYREILDKWPGILERLEETLVEARAAAEELAGLRLDRVDTLKEAGEAAELITASGEPIEEAADRIDAAAGEFDTDRERVARLQREIGTALETDYALLESAIVDPGSELSGIASQAVENLLIARLQENYGKLKRLLEAARRVSSQSASRPKAAARAGVEVAFPLRGYPRFLIEEFLLSVGKSGEDPFVEFQLRDIGSNPVLINRPTPFSLSLLVNGLGLEGTGELDLRPDEATLLAAEAEFAGGGFDIGNSLAYLGIEDLSGGLAGNLRLSIERDETGRGEGLLLLRPLRPRFEETGDPLKQAVREILRPIEASSLDYGFRTAGGSLRGLTIRSDLDDALSRQLGDYLARRAEELTGQLKAALTARIADELAENGELQELFGDYTVELTSLLEEGEDQEAILEAARKELEDQIEAIREESTRQATEEVKDLLKEAGKGLKLPF